MFGDLENADRFVLYEEWTSSEALEAHNQETHVIDFLAAANHLLAEPFQVTWLRSIR